MFRRIGNIGAKYSFCGVAIILIALAGDLFAGDDLSITECQRRSLLACVSGQFGPYRGIFLVDTGASSSITFHPERYRESPDAAWRFGELDGFFAIGSGTLAYVDGIQLRAFESDARKSRILFVETPPRSITLLGVDGIVGLPEMLEVAVRINLREQIVTKVASPWTPTAESVKLNLERRPHRDFRLPIQVASSVERPVTLDTGCRAFMFMQPSTLKFLERLGNAVQTHKVSVSTVTETRETKAYILKSVTIGGFGFRDIEVWESNLDAIGMGCLSHFDMVLDFPYNEMWLTPHSNDWPKRVPPDASGLVLGFQDTNLLSLVRIQPDSAASKSVLQVDDQILLFDGKEPKDLSMMEIHQRQTEARTILPLRVKRGDRVFDVQLPLGYSFEYPPKWPNKKNVLDEFGEFLEKDAKSPASEHVVPHK